MVAGLALGAMGTGAFAAPHDGGGGGGGGGFHGGGFGGGGVAHFSGRAGVGGRAYYGRGGGYYGGYGRGYWAGRGYWGGWGYGGWWWGPGWWGLGLFLPVIPWYYTTYWWDGVPYYYGDNGYYVWNGDASQYEQVTPPADFNPSAPPADVSGVNGAPPPTGDTELFAYPKAGQSADQQARDKAECRKWASDQVASQGAAGSPPAGAGGAQSAPGAGNATASEAMAQHQAYLHAEAACLEGRNYSVN